MTATYTWDIFSTLDAYGSYGPDGNWGGYWGKQGPELLNHRLATYDGEPVLVRQGRVVGATFHPELTARVDIHAEVFGERVVAR